MTTDAFRSVGGYDETLSLWPNEDAELDNRLIDHGFHVYLTGEVRVTYYPRKSLAGLFRQYFNIGRGRAYNFLKHRKNTKIRHLVLAAVVPIVCLTVLTPFAGIFAIPAMAWLSVCIGYGIVLGTRLGDACATASGVAAIAMQAGWSFGFFRGLITGLLQRGKPIRINTARKPTRQDQIAQ
jgi:succinoglycan biosynthesis protein ExoA